MADLAANPTPRELILALVKCVGSYVDKVRFMSLLRSIEYRMEQEDAGREWPRADCPHKTDAPKDAPPDPGCTWCQSAVRTGERA